MSDRVKFTQRTSEAAVPQSNGQTIYDTRPGHRKIELDKDGERIVMSIGDSTTQQRTMMREGLLDNEIYTPQEAFNKLAELSNFTSGIDTQYRNTIRTLGWVLNNQQTRLNNLNEIVERKSGQNFMGGFGLVTTGATTVAKLISISAMRDLNVFHKLFFQTWAAVPELISPNESLNENSNFPVMFSGTCTSAATTVAKVLSVRGINGDTGHRLSIYGRAVSYKYFGHPFIIRFTNAHTSATVPTLSVDGGASYPMYSGGIQITNANWSSIIGSSTQNNIFTLDLNSNRFQHVAQVPYILANNAEIGIAFVNPNTAANPTISINNDRALPMFTSAGVRMTGNVFAGAYVNMVFRYDQTSDRLVHVRNQKVFDIKEGATLNVTHPNAIIGVTDLMNVNISLNNDDSFYPIRDGESNAIIKAGNIYNIRFSSRLKAWYVMDVAEAVNGSHSMWLGTRAQSSWNYFNMPWYVWGSSVYCRYRFISPSDLEIHINIPTWFNSTNGTFFMGSIPELIGGFGAEFRMICQGPHGYIYLDNSGNMYLHKWTTGSSSNNFGQWGDNPDLMGYTTRTFRMAFRQ